MKNVQRTFNPADYEFEWKTWNDYSWNRKAAHKAALRARNDEVRRLRREGYNVTTFTLRDQIVSKGGIGTVRGHFDFCVNCYGLNASK